MKCLSSSDNNRLAKVLFFLQPAKVFLFFLVAGGGELGAVVGFDVRPAVVGPGDGGQGQAGFALVEQHLEQRVASMGVAVEDELDVTGHGEQAVAAPVGVERLGVGVGAAPVVQLEQGGQGQEVAVVAEAQVGGGHPVREGLGGAVEQVEQQVGGAEGHEAVRQGRVAVGQVPGQVVAPPQFVALLRGEEGEQLEAGVMALHDGGHGEELAHQPDGVHRSGIGGVGEERAHQPGGPEVAGLELALHVGQQREAAYGVHPGRGGRGEHGQVALAGAVGDGQRGVQRLQPEALGRHGEHDAGHLRGAGVDAGAGREDLREVAVHAPGYAPVLAGAARGELADAAPGHAGHAVHHRQRLAAKGGEHAQRVGAAEGMEGHQVVVHVRQVARAVAGEGADVEGFVALGGGRQGVGREGSVGHGVGAVVVG